MLFIEHNFCPPVYHLYYIIFLMMLTIYIIKMIYSNYTGGHIKKDIINFSLKRMEKICRFKNFYYLCDVGITLPREW